MRPPLPLPPSIDPTAIHEFDYRRVYTRGRFRHDQEMLVGPRLHDGNDGYMVYTPLDREPDRFGRRADTIIVCRGWIAKKFEKQRDRDQERGVPRGDVDVQGLLREPPKENMFTPGNRPGLQYWYFPDVEQMARITGAKPVYVEQTMSADRLVDANAAESADVGDRAKSTGVLRQRSAWDTDRKAARGKPPEQPRPVHLHLVSLVERRQASSASDPSPRYSLCLATSIMLWMIVRKPPSYIANRVRQNKEW